MCAHNYSRESSMPSFTVTDPGDAGGGGTLRDAIIFANANPGTTIDFDPALANQTITLSSALPPISADVTIDGSALDINFNPVSQHITISGGGARIFFVQSGDANIRYLTLANAGATGGAGTDGGGGGLGAGAAIFVATGNTTVSNVDFTGNAATGGVGGDGTSTGGAGGNGPDGTGGGTAGTGAGGGAGGFGGGGGAYPAAAGGHGGFGGGGGARQLGGAGGGQAGSGATGGGGGSAALGGAVFVEAGASLTIGGGTFTGSTVTHGIGGTVSGTNGAEVGSDLFLMASATSTYTFAPGSVRHSPSMVRSRTTAPRADRRQLRPAAVPARRSSFPDPARSSTPRATSIHTPARPRSRTEYCASTARCPIRRSS